MSTKNSSAQLNRVEAEDETDPNPSALIVPDAEVPCEPCDRSQPMMNEWANSADNPNTTQVDDKPSKKKKRKKKSAKGKQQNEGGTNQQATRGDQFQLASSEDTSLAAPTRDSPEDVTQRGEPVAQVAPRAESLPHDVPPHQVRQQSPKGALQNKLTCVAGHASGHAVGGTVGGTPGGSHPGEGMNAEVVGGTLKGGAEGHAASQNVERAVVEHMVGGSNVHNSSEPRVVRDCDQMARESRVDLSSEPQMARESHAHTGSEPQQGSGKKKKKQKSKKKGSAEPVGQDVAVAGCKDPLALIWKALSGCKSGGVVSQRGIQELQDAVDQLRSVDLMPKDQEHHPGLQHVMHALITLVLLSCCNRHIYQHELQHIFPLLYSTHRLMYTMLGGQGSTSPGPEASSLYRMYIQLGGVTAFHVVLQCLQSYVAQQSRQQLPGDGNEDPRLVTLIVCYKWQWVIMESCCKFAGTELSGALFRPPVKSLEPEKLNHLLNREGGVPSKALLLDLLDCAGGALEGELSVCMMLRTLLKVEGVAGCLAANEDKVWKLLEAGAESGGSLSKAGLLPQADLIASLVRLEPQLKQSVVPLGIYDIVACRWAPLANHMAAGTASTNSSTLALQSLDVTLRNLCIEHVHNTRHLLRHERLVNVIMDFCGAALGSLASTTCALRREYIQSGGGVAEAYALIDDMAAHLRRVMLGDAQGGVLGDGILASCEHLLRVLSQPPLRATILEAELVELQGSVNDVQCMARDAGYDGMDSLSDGVDDGWREGEAKRRSNRKKTGRQEEKIVMQLGVAATTSGHRVPSTVPHCPPHDPQPRHSSISPRPHSACTPPAPRYRHDVPDAAHKDDGIDMASLMAALCATTSDDSRPEGCQSTTPPPKEEIHDDRSDIESLLATLCPTADWTAATPGSITTVNSSNHSTPDALESSTAWPGVQQPGTSGPAARMSYARAIEPPPHVKERRPDPATSCTAWKRGPPFSVTLGHAVSTGYDALFPQLCSPGMSPSPSAIGPRVNASSVHGTTTASTVLLGPAVIPSPQSVPGQMVHVAPQVNPALEHGGVPSSLIVDDMVCPITCELMHDPVVAVDGYTYERSAIAAWFKTHDTSPMTNEHVETKALFANKVMKSMIQNLRQNMNAHGSHAP